MFFTKSLQRLASEEDMDAVARLSDCHFITLDKKAQKCDVGLTIGNTATGDGVKVVSVKKGGLAEQAGVSRGMVIITVNQHSVGSHSEAVSLIDRAAKGIVRLGLQRNDALHGLGGAVQWQRESSAVAIVDA
jgi:C-terminal processing protease CtpA/Prc